jgi:hypothetical protein
MDRRSHRTCDGNLALTIDANNLPAGFLGGQTPAAGIRGPFFMAGLRRIPSTALIFAKPAAPMTKLVLPDFLLMPFCFAISHHTKFFGFPPVCSETRN